MVASPCYYDTLFAVHRGGGTLVFDWWVSHVTRNGNRPLKTQLPQCRQGMSLHVKMTERLCFKNPEIKLCPARAPARTAGSTGDCAGYCLSFGRRACQADCVELYEVMFRLVLISKAVRGSQNGCLIVVRFRKEIVPVTSIYYQYVKCLIVVRFRKEIVPQPLAEECESHKKIGRAHV